MHANSLTVKLYSVVIKDSKPISSELITVKDIRKHHNEMTVENHEVHGLVVLADDEEDSFKIATQILKDLQKALKKAAK